MFDDTSVSLIWGSLWKESLIWNSDVMLPGVCDMRYVHVHVHVCVMGLPYFI